MNYLNPRLYKVVPKRHRRALIAHLNLIVAFSHQGGAWVGFTKVGQQRFADILGLDPRSVRRSEKRLAHLGLITIKTGLSGNSRLLVPTDAVTDSEARERLLEQQEAEVGTRASAPGPSGVNTAQCGHQRPTTEVDTTKVEPGHQRPHSEDANARTVRTQAPTSKEPLKKPLKETLPRKRGGDHQTVMDSWAELFKRVRGAAYAFQPKDFTAVKKLLALSTVDEIKLRAERMVAGPDEWKKQNASLPLLLGQWNSLSGAVSKRGLRSRIEEYLEDRDANFAAIKRA